MGTFIDGIAASGSTSANGVRTGGFFRFATSSGEKIYVKMGISLKSYENAQAFLTHQIPEFDMAAVERANKESWDSLLSTIIIEAPENTKRAFYSSFWLSMLMPRDRSTDNARWQTAYPMWDDHYAVWDTWRTKFPLVSIVREPILRDNVNAFIDRFMRVGSIMDDFVAQVDGPWNQGGDNPDNIIAEAYVKGVQGVNWQDGLAVLKGQSEKMRDPQYIMQGWAPEGCLQKACVSKTLEFNVNDFFAIKAISIRTKSHPINELLPANEHPSRTTVKVGLNGNIMLNYPNMVRPCIVYIPRR